MLAKASGSVLSASKAQRGCRAMSTSVRGLSRGGIVSPFRLAQPGARDRDVDRQDEGRKPEALARASRSWLRARSCHR